MRASRLFKLRLQQIIVERYADGNIQCIRWNDEFQVRLLHSCTSSDGHPFRSAAR